MLSVYLVVSEELSYVEVVDYWIGGPTEYYRIADLVVARNHGQAKWLAWKNDKDSFIPDEIREMPKMAVRIKRVNVEGPPRIATYEYDPSEPDFAHLWDLGTPPPHISIEEEQT